jgi:hypothetical protein
LKLSLVLLGRFMNLCEGVPKRLFVVDDIAPPTYIASLGFIDYCFDSFDCVITAKAVPLAGGHARKNCVCINENACLRHGALEINGRFDIVQVK